MYAKKQGSAGGLERVVMLKSGARLPLVGENDRYWLCHGTQFRKGGAQVARVEEIPVEREPTAGVDPLEKGEAGAEMPAEGLKEEGNEDADCKREV